MQVSHTFLTLANRTGIIGSGPAMTRGGTALSIRLQYAIQSLTVGNGPHSIWLTRKDLTLAQFEEYLEIQGPVQPGAVPEEERATRGKLLRYLGMAVPVGNGSVAVLAVKDLSLSGLRWTEESAGLQLIAYNEGIDMTTAALGRASIQLFVQWNKSG